MSFLTSMVDARAHQAATSPHNKIPLGKAGSGILERVAELNQILRDRMLVDAKLLGDRANAESIVAKGFESLSGDDQRVVIAHVLAGLNDEKVFRAIVQTVPVDVMDMLFGRQRATKNLFHDKAVLAHRLTVPRDVPVLQPVVAFINALAAAIMRVSATSGAKDSGLSPPDTGEPLERHVAVEAGEGASRSDIVPAGDGAKHPLGGHAVGLELSREGGTARVASEGVGDGSLALLESSFAGGRAEEMALRPKSLLPHEPSATGIAHVGYDGRHIHADIVAGQPIYVDVNPTTNQIRAGNYLVGRLRLHGLDISIENPVGSERVARDGSWRRTMRAHYGYIRGTKGADGDNVDCFIGPHPESEMVFVVDQVKVDGSFDEHKAILGCLSEEEARATYLSNYSSGWKVGPMTPLTMGEFKAWLEHHDTTEPIAPKRRPLWEVFKKAFAFLAKADPKRPGSRGGIGFFRASGRWKYGQRPMSHESVGKYYDGWEPHWYTPTPEQFVEARNKSAQPHMLTLSTPDDLRHHRLILSHDGKVGVAIDEHGDLGDLQNLFNNGGPRGAATEAIFAALDQGARTLDCFDLRLPERYHQFGFTEVGRLKFDDDHAPPGWDIARLGRPDVVFMAWRGYPDAKQQIRSRAHGKAEWLKNEPSRKYYSGAEWNVAKSDSRRAALHRPGGGESGQGVRGGERSGNPRDVASDRRPLGKSLQQSYVPSLSWLHLIEARPDGTLVFKSNVLHPGSRGGHYWFDKHGKVQYGDRPVPHARTNSGKDVHAIVEPSLAVFEAAHDRWTPAEHDEAVAHLENGPAGSPHLKPLTEAHRVAAAAKRGKRSESDRTAVDEAMARAWGDAYDEVRQPKQEREAKEEAPAAEPKDSVRRGDDDYAYRDVGYVAGSRKELAQEQIRIAARNGLQVAWQEVDWKALEENPRAAATLITKGNVFGDVNWSTMEAAGMDPGAAYLVRSIYASVATEPDPSDLRRRQAANGADPGHIYSLKRAAKEQPAGDVAATAQDREDYVRGINTLRERMEACKTPTEVLKTLEDISAERRGTMLSAQESDEYSKLTRQMHELRAAEQEHKARQDAPYQHWKDTQSKLRSLEYEQSKRAGRKWKPDPIIDAEVARLRVEEPKALAAFQAASDHEGRKTRDAQNQALWQRREAIETGARRRALSENPITRAWHTLGPRFAGLISYRQSDGSDSFAKNVAAVKAGKIDNWSWSKTEPKGRGDSTKQSTRFQLLVADKFHREGGRAVPIASSVELQQRYNLRAVQSGNWVLDDVNSGKFHMEQCAAGFADLADIIGVPDHDISLRGRLAMAFGARGKGGAKAHYEPVERVINMTKMAGAGSLAHEWFHALDNLMMAAHGVEHAGAFATYPQNHSSNSKLTPQVREAFSKLHDAMTTGNVRQRKELKISPADDRLVEANMGRDSLRFGGWRQAIVAAESLDHAMQSLDEIHAAGRFGRGRRGDAQHATARRIAGAWWTKDQAGTERAVTVSSGPATSQYLADARALNGSGDKATTGYWSKIEELGARAFAGYVSDRLERSGRSNDYLTYKANNRFYREAKPYPEGAERERINDAFDGLMAALREEKSFAKAATALETRWSFLWSRVPRPTMQQEERSGR